MPVVLSVLLESRRAVHPPSGSQRHAVPLEDVLRQHNRGDATALPLGAVTSGPPLVPNFQARTVEDVRDHICEEWYAADRLSASSTTTAVPVVCVGTFLQRTRRVLERTRSAESDTFNMPMALLDLLAAYYYRRVQAEVATHVCRLGFCREKWDKPGKFGLPCDKVPPDKRCAV